MKTLKSTKKITKGKKEVKRNIEKGTNVLIFRDTIKDKWLPKWWAGYTVTDYVGDDAYLVRERAGNRFIRVNKCHVKKDTPFYS